jgi:hypothetical protein
MLLEIDAKGNLSLLPNEFVTESDLNDFVKANPGKYSIIHVQEIAE